MELTMKFLISSEHTICEDSYEQGELNEVETISEKMRVIEASNIQTALVIYFKQLGLTFNYKYCHKESLTEFEYSNLVDENYNEATDSEKEDWKKGELKLFSNNSIIKIYELVGHKTVEDKYKIVEQNSDTNLCELYYSVNGGAMIVKPEYNTTKSLEDTFRVEKPTIFSAELTKNQYEKLAEYLASKNTKFQFDYIPKGYYKGQREPLYSLTLNLGYINKRPFVKIDEMKLTYGVGY